MRTSICLIVLSLGLFFALPSISSAQGGGNGTGACEIHAFGKPTGAEDGKIPEFSACVDDVSAIECEAFCGEVGDDPEGGIGTLCDFHPGLTCAVVSDWDGACDDVSLPGVGDVCVLISSGESQAICEKLGQGTWLGDGSVCGGAPVPAMPRAGYAALALLLLAGSLALLTLQNRS